MQIKEGHFGVYGECPKCIVRNRKFSFLAFFKGTSTDVSRYAGEYEHVFETTTAGVTIQAPQVSCNLSKFFTLCFKNCVIQLFVSSIISNGVLFLTRTSFGDLT